MRWTTLEGPPFEEGTREALADPQDDVGSIVGDLSQLTLETDEQVVFGEWLWRGICGFGVSGNTAEHD